MSWPPLSERPFSVTAAIADVVAVDGDQLLAALGRLFFFSELVVFPASFVFPQFPVSSFRSFLLLGVASHVVFKEQTFSGNVGGVLSVLIVVQLLTWFPPRLGLRVIGGLLYEIMLTVMCFHGSCFVSGLYCSYIS